MARRDPSAPKRLAELAGAPPRMASAEDLESAGPRTGYTHPASVSAAAKGHPRINLRTVAEACVEAGLDPAAEITKALAAMRPMVLNGRQVFDEDGLPVMIPVVDADTRMRTLNELLQYVQPKLKSVEVKMSGSLELTSEQIDQRLAALLAKAVR